MIKRIAATLILDSNYIVNSYDFNVHLPIGKLKYTMQRLQEFEVDEINILNTSHSNSPVSDFNTLFTDISDWHISTPIGYGGGITSLEDAIQLVSCGIERVIISAKTFFDINLFNDICSSLGDQAVILHLPLEFDGVTPSIRGYKSRMLTNVCDIIPKNWGGEIMLSITKSDGLSSPNWQAISEALKIMSSSNNIILAGGFARFEDIAVGLSLNQVTAISIGNYLHRAEQSIIKIKNNINSDIQIRR